MSDANPAGGDIVFIDPGSRLEIREISPSEREAAAAILASATGEGTTEAATRNIDELRSMDKSALLGAFVDRELVAVYGIRRDGMANEVTLIAVRADHQKRGIGRAMLQDALRRSGRRPVIAETDDQGLKFYKACGFKVFGRRVHPSGVVRWRIGWHAPGAAFKGGTSGALEYRGVETSPERPDGNE